MSKSGAGQARAQAEAGELQAVTATNVGQRQSLTALEASEMRASAIERASAVSAGGQRGFSADQGNALIQGGADRASELIRPFAEVGNSSLQALEQGSTAEGFAARLASIIDTDIYQDVRDERYQVADARASAAGMNRSGRALQEAANISTQTAMGLDSELYNRQLTNVGIGQQGTNRLADIELGTAGQIASNTNAAARSQASASGARANAQSRGILGAADARAGGLEQSAFFETSGVMGAANARAGGLIGSEDAKAQARQNRNDMVMGVVSAGAQIAASPAAGALLFGSDERLKNNMTPIGKIADLVFYKWDWKPQFKGLLGMEMNKGFGASEVEDKYPECVQEVSGIKFINYPKLSSILKSRLSA